MHACTQPNNGRQLYIELLVTSAISRSLPKLVDRFAIDVVIPAPPNALARRRYTGLYGLVEIDATFKLGCSPNFYGPHCNEFCLQNCTLCSVDVNCGQNRRCVNRICVCEPGFIGTDCSTDPCMGVNCNSGTCEREQLGFYTCMCDPGYTGQFCERRVDSYRLQVTIHSFSNPDGNCAAWECSPDICCGGSACPSPCEYLFSLCLKPAGSLINNMREINPENCATFETLPSRLLLDGGTFTDSIFGTFNPINLTGIQWVSLKQLYSSSELTWHQV